MGKKTAFEFNKIYIIQSLDGANKELTGTDLYYHLLKWQSERQIEALSIQLININDKIDFDEAMKEILDACSVSGIYPIIHFEIHGSEDHSGLALNSGEAISWGELNAKLSEINEISALNLFVTMAVCFGGYYMTVIKPDKPAPFWGIIGSFNTLYESDLLVRYNAFYEELLTSFDFDEAVKKLRAAQTSFPDTYRFINAENVFKNVWNKYNEKVVKVKAESDRHILEAMSPEQLKLISDANVKVKFLAHAFAERIKLSRKKLEEQKAIFFMYEKHQKNKKRFKVNITIQ